MFFYNGRLQKRYLILDQFAVHAENHILVENISDGDLLLSPEERTNLGMVLGAYRSFRGQRRNRIAYVSMPITTGKRLYDVLAEEGVGSVDELARKLGKDALWRLVIQPNTQAGISFADQLGFNDDLLFIAPSVFEAKKWRWQEHTYMALWYRVIGELVGSHFLMNDWEYSIGGSKEVLFSMLMQWGIVFPLDENNPESQAIRQIRLFDASGNELKLDAALDRLVDACETLKSRGLPHENLLRAAWNMMMVPVLSPLVRTGETLPYDPFSAIYQSAEHRLKRLYFPAIYR